MGIVTKRGDRRRTHLLSGEEVLKTDVHIVASGDLDELLSCLGLARAILMRENHAIVKDADLVMVQRELLRVGAELSCTEASRIGWVSPIVQDDIARIESNIEALECKVRLPREFVLPGNTESSAALDVARSVARRLERSAIALAETGAFQNNHALVYLNRLSDYLFLLARAAEGEK